jgi:glutamate-1-semialdehyde 2,1-aminomutase
MGNMGVILPEENFLNDVQKLCQLSGILLIYDEVITGFRVAYGGAQHIYGTDPDITCLGKIIGGGFAIGAFGGKRKIMESLAPLGDTYQAGTLSGNPIAVRAGIYTLQYLRDHKEAYDLMKRSIELAKDSIQKIAMKYGIPYRINSATGMFTGFFSGNDVSDYDSAVVCDKKAYEIFFKHMLSEGIFFAPSQFEASILTLCHKEREISKTIDTYEKVFKTMGSSL